MVHPILSYMLNSCRLRIHKIWKYSVRSIWSGHFDEICLTIDSTSNVIPSPARMILSIYRKLKYCIADVHMYKHIFLKRKYIHVYIYIWNTDMMLKHLEPWCLEIHGILATISVPPGILFCLSEMRFFGLDQWHLLSISRRVRCSVVTAR